MKILNVEINKNLIVFVLSLGVVLFLFIFLLTTNQIGASVREKCLIAQGKYDGDCEQALIQTLEDEKNGFHQRNDAIWALGQLGDKRALEVLERYYTNQIPPKEPYDETISQYELEKAINLINGGVNLGAWVWRDGNFSKLF